MTPARGSGAALGLDIGTSGVRALIVDSGGRRLGKGEVKHPLLSSRPGYAEQRPLDWWHGTVTATAAALAAAGVDGVDGIGLSGQMHGSVLLDAELSPLRPALLWCDSRAAGDATAVTESVGRTEIIRAAGNLPMPGFTAPQLRWLARAGELGAARSVLCTKDCIRAWLTGNVATDPSDASGTGLFGLEGAWNEDLVRAYGVDPALLPPVIESSEEAGRLTRTAAAELGLAQGTPVAAGAADNAAAALGSGVISPGKLLLSVGTSGTIVVPVAAPLPDTTGRCHLFRHAFEGTWYSMAVVLSAGGALSWWQSVIDRPIEELAAAAATVPPGSEGVIMLPFLSGRRMPELDPAARATFSGMSLSHGTAHLTRAVMEGAGYALAEGLECIRDLGLDAVDAVVTGGAAQHQIWREILTLALPDLHLHTALPEDGAAMGAALLGLAVAGAPLEPLVGRAVAHHSLDRPPLARADQAAVASGFERYRALAATPTLTGAPGSPATRGSMESATEEAPT